MRNIPAGQIVHQRHVVLSGFWRLLMFCLTKR